jgi:hypothetical protein
MGGMQLRAPRGKGRRRVLVVAVALVAVVVVATARAASVISETTWGGPLSEVTNGAAVASDGSSYLTGFTNSFDPSGQQVFLTKFAGDGSLSWQRTFQGPEQFRTDEGKGVAVTPDGSVYVTGQTVGVQGDVLLLKFSPDGALEWQRRWDGGGRESGEALAVASDGAVYVIVGGETGSFGAGGDDAFLLQLDPGGRGLACNTWGGPGSDHGDDVELAPDGTVVLGGTTESPSPATFGTCPRQVKRLRAVVAAPVVPLTDATGAVADPNGTVATPNGTSPGAGGFDAALVRIAP